MSLGKGFLGLLIGGAIGSAAAFLFAPKRGKEVREDIKHNFDDMVNQTKEKGKRLFNKSLDVVDDIVKKSDELRSLIQEYKKGTFDGTIEKVENEINRLKTALYAAIDTYKNSRERDKSSDELVNNIYNEFQNEAVPNKSESIH
jgi:gas vesicle protein